MKRVFKSVYKIVRFLGKPLTHRGFSRVDLYVLLLLGLAIVANLLLHVFQPASAARATTPQVAQAQTGHTSSQIAGPSGAQSSGPQPIPSPPPADSSKPTKQRTPNPQPGPAPVAPKQTATAPAPKNPCPPNTSYPQFSEGNIQDPFGGHAYLFFFTDPGVTVQECHITAITNVLAFAVNMALVIVFLLVGIRLMLAGSVIRYASALELLPGVILAILAANLVLPIAQITLDANNSLTQFVYTTVEGMPVSTIEYNGNDIVTKTCNHWFTVGGAIVGSIIPGLGSIVGGILGESIGCNVDPYTHDWQQTLNNSPGVPDITQGSSPGGLMFAFNSMTDLLQFVLSIMILMLLGQMAVRLLVLDLFIATGPLGLAASALPGPGGKTLTKLWLQGFLTTVFVQFLQVIALIIVRLIIGALTSSLYASLGNTSAVNNDGTLLWVMQIAEYWFILRIPGLLRLGPTSPMNMVMEYGQTMAQTAQSAVSDSMTMIQLTLGAVSSAAGIGTSLAFIR